MPPKATFPLQSRTMGREYQRKACKNSRVFTPIQTKETLSFDRMGIGLAFCGKVAKLHDGTLDIESIEGQGTTVTVRLPRLKSS